MQEVRSEGTGALWEQARYGLELHRVCLFALMATGSHLFFSFLQGRPGPPGVAGPQGEKVSQAQGRRGLWTAGV